jgi:hypothetical protein
VTATQEVVRCNLAGLYDALGALVGKQVKLSWKGHDYTGPLHAAALYTLSQPNHHHHILLSLTTGRWSVYKAEAVWFVAADLAADTPAVMYLLDDAAPNDSLLPDAHWEALFAEVTE